MFRQPVALSLLYFAFAVFMAYRQDWQAHDIVWSMWVASLVGGYAFILLSILLSALGAGGQQSTGPGKALFLLFFFTVHFGGFHFVHGQIMQGFFPLGDQDLDFWSMLVKTVTDYWYFVLVALLNLLPRMIDLWREGNGDRGPRFELPYQAVIRNHLMIFVVAFANNFVSTPALLYLLLFLYFFPFSELANMRKSNRSDS